MLRQLLKELKCTRKDNKYQKGQVHKQVLSLFSCVAMGNNLGKANKGQVCCKV